MSVSVVTQQNIAPSNMVQKHPSKDTSGKQILKVYQTPEDAPNSVKAGVFSTTLLGVAAAMALTFRSKGMPKGFKSFFNNLITIKYEKGTKEKPKHEVEKLIGRLAVGSVGGGLIGGAIFDKKEHMNSKFRESIIQLVGNIATPLCCVAGGLALFEKLGGKAEGKYGVIASAVSLVTGILLGNKVGNAINLNLFRIDENRKIKLSDMSPHIDDVCFALSLVASKNSSKLGERVSRIIPAALMVAGLSTGCMQEHTEVIKAKQDERLKKLADSIHETV